MKIRRGHGRTTLIFDGTGEQAIAEQIIFKLREEHEKREHVERYQLRLPLTTNFGKTSTKVVVGERSQTRA